MRKLILGIVAVFCVQITFQAFTVFDLSDADRQARLAERPLVGPVEGSNALQVAEVPDDGEPASESGPAVLRTSIPRRVVTTDFTVNNAVHTRPAPRRVDATRLVAMAERPATPDDFAPRTISYTAYLSAKESARTEKRSFFSRALPVIKKPYDLLKAVGSRLK